VSREGLSAFDRSRVAFVSLVIVLRSLTLVVLLAFDWGASWFDASSDLGFVEAVRAVNLLGFVILEKMLVILDLFDIRYGSMNKVSEIALSCPEVC
ncbi:unnamed protein product, partial [Arabidopsis halleri]